MIIEKKCSRCGVTKAADSFESDKKSTTGLACWCRACRSETRKARYYSNREKEIAANKKWSQANKERHEFLKNRWHDENKEHYAQQQKEYRDNRKDLISEYGREWYAKNKEHKLILGRHWYQRNKEYKDARNRQWRKDNPAKARQLARVYRMVNADRNRFQSAQYRAKKLEATPLWLNQDQIDEVLDFHKAARLFQIYTGVEYHVDHIVPLQGETVCGLHVPWNLQLLPWNENLSKQNRHWPDMPE